GGARRGAGVTGPGGRANRPTPARNSRCRSCRRWGSRTSGSTRPSGTPQPSRPPSGGWSNALARPCCSGRSETLDLGGRGSCRAAFQSPTRLGRSLPLPEDRTMMTHREALDVLAAHRRDHVVITTMGSVALWPAISDTPRDFHYLPSSMGQGVPLGLGLCLAKPGLGVVVLTGDGGLLMNLGCLAPAAQHRIPPYVVLTDNGLYEVTRGQPVAAPAR